MKRALILLALTCSLAACSDSKSSPLSGDSAGPSATEVPTTGPPSGPPTTTATTIPPGPPSTRPAPAVSGKPVTTEGAVLKTGRGTVKEFDSADGCASFADDGGWQATCKLAHTAGGDTYAVVQRRPVGDATAWRAEVLTFNESAGGWSVALRAADDEGITWTQVTATVADLTADAKPEIVFAFRSQGTGDFLNLDLVTRSSGGGPTVVGHRELSHGSAHLEGTALVDYSADHPNSEPECCPPYWFRTVIRWAGTAFVETETSQVKEPPASPLG
jgi:hypothetical protein